MSNLTIAILLWILTLVFVIAAVKIKNKTLSFLFRVLVLASGFAAFGFSSDAVKDYKLAASNKAYEERELSALSDSINAATTTVKTRYDNIKAIISEHSAETKPLVCDPAVSKDNYAAVLSKIMSDAKEFNKLENDDSGKKLLIDNCLYLNCLSDSARFDDLVVMSSEYVDSAVNYIGTRATRIDEILALTSEQLNRESQWMDDHRSDLYEALSRPQDYLGKFMQLLRSSQYLAMVHMEYALKPQVGENKNAYTTYFKGGCGCGRVDVYDTDTGALKESFRVFFINDAEMQRHYDMKKSLAEARTRNEYLWKNLLTNMRRSVAVALAQRGYPHHTK